MPSFDHCREISSQHSVAYNLPEELANSELLRYIQVGEAGCIQVDIRCEEVVVVVGDSKHFLAGDSIADYLEEEDRLPAAADMVDDFPLQVYQKIPGSSFFDKQ